MTIKIQGSNTAATPGFSGSDGDSGVVVGAASVDLVANGQSIINATPTSVDIKEGATSRINVANGEINLNIDGNTDIFKITNTAGDYFRYQPGFGHDDWSRHLVTFFRKDYNENGGSTVFADLPIWNLNAAGSTTNIGSITLGAASTDANSPTYYYTPLDARGLTIYQGISSGNGKRIQGFFRARSADNDDYACFYYADSGDASTVIDYDQDQRLKMTGSGRMQGLNTFFSGRVESDEGGATVPNSVYTGSTGNGFFAYYNSGLYTYMRGRSTDNTDACIYVDSGGGPIFKVESSGRIEADGSYASPATDYAEYFEWEDGNPSNEDRRGLSVVTVAGGKIRKATASDAQSSIVGVVSAVPSLVGDAAYLNWQGRHLKDELGSYVTVDEEFLVWNKRGTYTNEAGEKVERPQPDVTDPQCEPDNQVLVSEIAQTPDIPQYAIDNDLRITKKARVTNPDFNPNMNYTPREQRPEWDAIGLLGKLWLKPGQIVGDRWIKLQDGSNGLTRWLVR